jgi:hypothetical protein
MNLHNLKGLGTLKSLNGLNPITKTKIEILPNQIELTCLSMKLLYKSHQLINNEITSKKVSANECLYKAMDLLEIIEDFENKHITHKELKQIRKDFKLN